MRFAKQLTASVSKILTLGLLLASMGTVRTANAGDPIHLVTEEYPPFNYQEDGELRGLSVELMEAIMADAGLEYDMAIMPWARAVSLAENTPGHCVFTTVHNKARDNRFAWVQPLLTSYSYLVKKSGSPVKAETIEDARGYLVGTQRGDYTVGVLEEKGFKRIDLAAEFGVSLKKLLMGRIDLMPMAGTTAREEILKGTPIETTLLLVQNPNGVACNKDIDPAALAAMQASLNKLIENGTREAIFKKYGFVEGVK